MHVFLQKKVKIFLKRLQTSKRDKNFKKKTLKRSGLGPTYMKRSDFKVKKGMSDDDDDDCCCCCC